MVAKILKYSLLPAGLALIPYGLYAISDREPKGRPQSPHQWSVYSVPPRESRFIQEDPGRLNRSFTAVRSAVLPVVTWGKNAGDAIKNGVVDTIEFAQDSYVYLKKPPPEFLPRVGVIGVSGLAGLFLARGGSRLKKVVYPIGLTALGVSVCYPAQAIISAKKSGNAIKNGAVKTIEFAQDSYVYLKKEPSEILKWVGVIGVSGSAGLFLARRGSRLKKVVYPIGLTALGVSVCYLASPIFTIMLTRIQNAADPGKPDSVNSPRNERVEGDPKLTEEEKLLTGEGTSETATEEPIGAEHAEPPNTQDGSTRSVLPAKAKQSVFTPPPGLTDHGQSNPEDVDMYSTRS